jgi:hypothetical protein
VDQVFLLNFWLLVVAVRVAVKTLVVVAVRANLLPALAWLWFPTLFIPSLLAAGVLVLAGELRG